MAVYYLFQNVTTVQNPPTPAIPPSIVLDPPSPGLSGTPPVSQGFILTVDSLTAPSTTVSASAQVVISNDGINWVNYGNPISVTAGLAPQSQAVVASGPWSHMGAYLTAISGSGARATLTVSL